MKIIKGYLNKEVYAFVRLKLETDYTWASLALKRLYALQTKPEADKYTSIEDNFEGFLSTTLPGLHVWPKGLL